MIEISNDILTSHDYFEYICRNSRQNSIILMDDDGTIMTVNRAFSDSFGYHTEELRGKNIAVLFTGEARKKLKPERELEEVKRAGFAFDNNFLVAKDQSAMWVAGESILVKNDNGSPRIVKILQNIHHQKITEDSLDQLNGLNVNILSAIKDAVIVFDQELNIITANSAFNNLFRSLSTGSSFPGSFASLLRSNNSLKPMQGIIEMVINSRKSSMNNSIELEVSSGENKVFDVNCCFLPNLDGGDNILVAMHDVTLYKRMEREREDVIGFVAHELRNPLANLVLAADLLKDALRENNQDDIEELLHYNKKNVLRLNKLIEELYNATIINSGNLKLDKTNFCLEEMITEAIGTVKGLQPGRKIEHTGNAGIEVYGDKFRLIQVVTNYLSNAIKYSPPESRVKVNVSFDESTVTIGVEDKGVGIPAADLPFIFDRFFRADKNRNIEGIGLGLYLCRQIIQAHRGKVWAESEDGKGSTFYCTVPRRS